MAIAFGGVLGNNATFSPGSPVTSRGFSHSGAPAGSHIIVGAAWYADSNGATYSSLSGGLTWTVDHIATPLADTNFTIAQFSAPAPAGLSAGTITLTLTANAYGLNLGGIYATGVATSSYEDGTSAATGHSGLDAVWGSTITTANANDLLVGFGYFEGDSITSTENSGAGYSEALDWAHAGTGNSQTMVYRVVSSTGTYTPGGTFSSSSTQKMSVAAAYKADAAGGGGAPLAPTLQFIRSNIRIGP